MIARPASDIHLVGTHEPMDCSQPIRLAFMTLKAERSVDRSFYAKGKSMRFSYRIVLHDGGLDPEIAEADSKKFANDPRPELVSERP